MNKLNIASTGYPGTTESWKFLNTMIQELAEAVAGQVIDTSTPVIIYGIRQNQIGYTDGFFVYKGELFRFKGGQPQDYVVIIEDVTNATYNTDMTNSSQLADFPTYYKRYARFGGANEGIDRFLFADMKRMKGLFDISEKVNPATEDSAGIVEIATQAEVDAGVDDSKAVTSLGLNNLLTNKKYIRIVDEGEWETTFQDGGLDEHQNHFYINIGLQDDPVHYNCSPFIDIISGQVAIHSVNAHLIKVNDDYKIVVNIRYQGTLNSGYEVKLKVKWVVYKNI